MIQITQKALLPDIIIKIKDSTKVNRSKNLFELEENRLIFFGKRRHVSENANPYNTVVKFIE